MEDGLMKLTGAILLLLLLILLVYLGELSRPQRMIDRRACAETIQTPATCMSPDLAALQIRGK